MKITKSQLKAIILEEAAKVKKEMELRKQLDEVNSELEEVLGGPHGKGTKTYKGAKGDFVPGEFPGALVEKEEEMEETYSMEEGDLAEMAGSMEEEMHEGETHEEELSEAELDEMFKMMEAEFSKEDNLEEITGSEGAESPEELEKMDEGKKEDKEEETHSLQESAEVLRMKKLAGLIK
jgi:hypothetical protein